jgi:hypothetical protein
VTFFWRTHKRDRHLGQRQRTDWIAVDGLIETPLIDPGSLLAIGILAEVIIWGLSSR